MNRPYAGRESPPMIQKHAATCFFGTHEIQQLATACRCHTTDKTFNDLTILACYD